MVLKVKKIILKEQNFKREDIIKGNIKFELKLELRIIKKEKMSETKDEDLVSEIIANLIGRLEDNSVVITAMCKYILVYENDAKLIEVNDNEIEEETKNIIFPYIRETLHSITFKGGIPGLIIP